MNVGLIWVIQKGYKMKQVKIQIGEWIAVYHTVVGYVSIPEDQPINKENVLFYANEDGVDIENEDVDWSTVTHEEWDSDSVKILEQPEERTEDENK